MPSTDRIAIDMISFNEEGLTVQWADIDDLVKAEETGFLDQHVTTIRATQTEELQALFVALTSTACAMVELGIETNDAAEASISAGG